jgi:hypothetical protein
VTGVALALTGQVVTATVAQHLAKTAAAAVALAKTVIAQRGNNW